MFVSALHRKVARVQRGSKQKQRKRQGKRKLAAGKAVGGYFNRNLLALVFLPFLVYFLSTFLASGRSWSEVVELNNKRNSMKLDIVMLDEENRLLRKRIEQISHDPNYIEKIAREELRMVKSGERVYKFGTFLLSEEGRSE